MKFCDLSDNYTDHSSGLKPVYAKAQQLVRLKQQQKQHQRKSQTIKIIEPVPKIQLKMQINRLDQYKRRKESLIQNTQQKTLRPSNTVNKMPKLKAKQLKTKTKSQKLINFLRSTQTKYQIKRNQTPCFQNIIEEQRQGFTPMRPLSRISRPAQSVAGTEFTRKSGSNNKSLGGYSQIARLNQSSNSSSNPTKYLRKGHRMRQVLTKHLNTPEDIQQQKELVYLKQYDQWVPASLASYKRLQLQHFMNILTGGKKNIKKQSILFEPVYL